MESTTDRTAIRPGLCTAGLVLAAALGLAPAAFAHDVWIAPSSFAPRTGQLVRLDLVVGEDGGPEVLTRNPAKLVRFAALGGGAEVDLPGLGGRAPAGLMRPRSPGLWTVIYEGNDTYSELAAERFEAYLEEEGLDAVLRKRRESGRQGELGRELYSRSLKSLLAVGGAADLAEDAPIGLPLELVVESLAQGRALELRLLHHGRPLEGCLVEIRPLDAPEPAEARRSGPDGRVRFPARAGAWLVTAVHMEPSPSPKADWKSTWTALTFSLDEPSPPSEPPRQAASLEGG